MRSFGIKKDSALFYYLPCLQWIFKGFYSRAFVFKHAIEVPIATFAIDSWRIAFFQRNLWKVRLLNSGPWSVLIILGKTWIWMHSSKISIKALTVMLNFTSIAADNLLKIFSDVIIFIGLPYIRASKIKSIT